MGEGLEVGAIKGIEMKVEKLFGTTKNEAAENPSAL